MTGPPKRLRITVEGCILFDQTIQGRWSATFGLGDCPLVPPELEIALQSDTHVPSTRDTRELGVAVSLIELRGAALPSRNRDLHVACHGGAGGDRRCGIRSRSAGTSW